MPDNCGAIATLTETVSTNVHELPYEFQYIPFRKQKRIFYLKTSKGVVSQKGTPLFTYGGDEDRIEWKITLTTRATAELFSSISELNDTFTFNGYWGEEFLVEFDKPVALTPKGGYFELSGSMRVLCVTTNFSGCGGEIEVTTTTTTT